jgi:2-polyprenyl-3-methyl-5-hydroxy-6-metoxy-1,4-benzoquinol methylase
MKHCEAAGIVCQICSGTSFRHIKEENNYNWVICENCSFVRLAENIFGSDDGNAISYISGALRKFSKKQDQARRRVALMTRMYNGKSFLDIGCNLGFVTNQARERGLSATGLEMNQMVVDFAKCIFTECEFICSSLEKSNLPSSNFDLVYCSEVVEHVIEVGDFLSEIKRVMRPSGLLYLTTPHIREYKDPSRIWGAPNHKVYFNNENLTTLLKAVGFKEIKIVFNLWKGIELFAHA